MLYYLLYNCSKGDKILMKIYCENKNIFLKNRLKKIFNRALEITNNNLENLSVGVRFVDDKEIQTLNNEHRGVDKVTDVLSFPMLDIKAGQKIEEVVDELEKIDGEIYLGDIVICKNKVYSQAREYKHTRKRELNYLALHSLLHLLGYDHQTKAQEKKMFCLAEKILGYDR